MSAPITPDTPVVLSATLTQVVIATIAIISSIIGGVFACTRWLGTQFQALKDDLGTIKSDGLSVKGWLSALLMSLDTKLHAKDKKHLSEQAKRIGITAQASGNPISAEEAKQINVFLEKVIKQKDFSPEEAEQFKRLIELYVVDEDIKKANDQGKLDVLLGIATRIYRAYYLHSDHIGSK